MQVGQDGQTDKQSERVRRTTHLAEEVRTQKGNTAKPLTDMIRIEGSVIVV